MEWLESYSKFVQETRTTNYISSQSAACTVQNGKETKTKRSAEDCLMVFDGGLLHGTFRSANFERAER